MCFHLCCASVPSLKHMAEIFLLILRLLFLQPLMNWSKTNGNFCLMSIWSTKGRLRMRTNKPLGICILSNIQCKCSNQNWKMILILIDSFHVLDQILEKLMVYTSVSELSICIPREDHFQFWFGNLMLFFVLCTLIIAFNQNLGGSVFFFFSIKHIVCTGHDYIL